VKKLGWFILAFTTLYAGALVNVSFFETS